MSTTLSMNVSLHNINLYLNFLAENVASNIQTKNLLSKNIPNHIVEPSYIILRHHYLILPVMVMH